VKTFAHEEENEDEWKDEDFSHDHSQPTYEVITATPEEEKPEVKSGKEEDT